MQLPFSKQKLFVERARRLFRAVLLFLSLCPPVAFGCPSSDPSSVSLLGLEPFYSSGKSQDSVDQLARERYDSMVSQFRALQRGSGWIFNRLSSRVIDKDAARNCFEKLVNPWIVAGTRSFDVNSSDRFAWRQSGLIAAWTVISLNQTYQLIYRQEIADSAWGQERYSPWLSSIEQIIYDRVLTGARALPEKSDWTVGISNHHMWGAAAIISRPRSLGTSRYRSLVPGLVSMFADSIVDNQWPSEAVRGSRSLYYHLFSIQALGLAFESGLRCSELSAKACERIALVVENSLGALFDSLDGRSGSFGYSQNASLSDFGGLVIIANSDAGLISAKSLSRLRVYLQSRSPIYQAFSGRCIFLGM